MAKKKKTGLLSVVKKAALVWLLMVVMFLVDDNAQHKVNMKHLNACKETVSAGNPDSSREDVEQFCQDHITSVLTR